MGCPWRGHITLGVAAPFEGRRTTPTEGFEGQQLPTFLTTWGVNDLTLQGAVGSTPQHPYTSDADIGKHWAEKLLLPLYSQHLPECTLEVLCKYSWVSKDGHGAPNWACSHLLSVTPFKGISVNCGAMRYCFNCMDGLQIREGRMTWFWEVC